jgi:DNA-binding beta-propeller fold protein YncE
VKPYNLPVKDEGKLIFGKFEITANAGIEFDESDDSVQSLAPPSSLQRFEGIAFSSSGNIIAVATSDTNTVFLFRRQVNGLFEETPYCCLDGPRSRLNYPHDVSFSQSGDTELLAVAQRGGAIAIYEKHRADEDFGPDPVFEISGPNTKLNFSDGVAFVPPNNDYLAVCNLEIGSISFYQSIARSPVSFKLEPVFELRHRSLCNPDGLAFSQCGRWLAVANHGNHTVVVFQRRSGIFSGSKLSYGPKPVSLIKDPGLRHPHSVAFTPATSHLLVTNAGANYFSVYQHRSGYFKMHWSQSPAQQKTVGPDSVFKEVNARNKMEGGPKGIAVYKNNVAICSPEYGIKIYSFREENSLR